MHEDDWPGVRRALDRLHVGYAPNPPESYGLRRVRLSRDYDALTEDRILHEIDSEFAETHRGRARFGRNRLMARARIEFDDVELEGTPKVMPSSFEPAKPAAPPSDPLQYRTPTGGRMIRVGVVDSALTRHAALDGACVYRPVPPSDLVHGSVVGDVTGHATFIAGIISRIAPSSVIHVENVVEADGLADMVAVHDAICRLVDNGVDVINLSLGCVTSDDDDPFVLAHAFEWAREHENTTPVFVGSSGNGGTDKKFWPAAHPEVWAVAGARRAGDGWALTDYSGRGDWVDLAAPSDNLYSTWPHLGPGIAHFDSWATWSGTSFATAVVTGLVAASLASGQPPVRPGDGELDLPGARSTVADESGDLPLYGTDAALFAPAAG